MRYPNLLGASCGPTYGWLLSRLAQVLPFSSNAALELLMIESGSHITCPSPVEAVILRTCTMLCNCEVVMLFSTTPVSIVFMPLRPLVNWKGVPDCIREMAEICQPSTIFRTTGLAPARN